MKLSTTLLFLFGVLSPLAQADKWDLKSVPKCAHQCLTDAIHKCGCKVPIEPACVCRSKEFKETATPCIKNKCSMGDALKTRDWAKKMCKSITS